MKTLSIILWSAFVLGACVAEDRPQATPPMPPGQTTPATPLAVADDSTRPRPVIKGATPPDRLRVDGVNFVGANGRKFLPVFAAELTILSKAPGDRDARLDEITALGFNGVRVFAGAVTWAGQTAASARAALPSFLDAAAARGLYALVTVVTDSRDGGYSVAEHLHDVVGILRSYPGTIAECANEYYHASQSRQVNDAQWLAQLCRVAFAQSLIPWALGAPNVDAPDPNGVWPIPVGDFVTIHLDRGRDKWNQVRRVRELFAIREATKRPVLNSEPIGAAEVAQPGRREDDPAFFFALGVLNRAFDIGGVFHSEDGVNARPLGPVQTACAEAFLAGVAAIPGDASLRHRSVGWAGSPVSAAQFVEAGGVVVGADAFISPDGSAFVVVLHARDVLPSAAISWADDWRIVERLPSRPHVTLLKVARGSGPSPAVRYSVTAQQGSEPASNQRREQTSE